MSYEPRDITDDLAAMSTDRRVPDAHRDIALRALSEIQSLRAFRETWEGRKAPRLRRHRRPG